MRCEWCEFHDLTCILESPIVYIGYKTNGAQRIGGQHLTIPYDVGYDEIHRVDLYTGEWTRIWA